MSIARQRWKDVSHSLGSLVRCHAPEVVYDLPAESPRLIQHVDGYRYTICSGEVIYEDGEPTGALPGKLIRGPQPAPSQARMGS